MFKNLKNYYVAVALPFALLLVGAAVFFEPIKSTILRNPHPQINYTIFVIILTGGVFIIVNAHRLVHEARTLVDFTGATRARTDSATLQEMTNRYTGDISYLLQMITASAGRAISHQEQVAIEHELTNARARLTRRNALPQYLSGLLVGMGLLGTFIGLLATLNDISVLISSFAELDMNNVNPLAVFRTMIERMKAPMQSMAIAFSASMFGLLGSIVLGLMMVGMRRLQGDIFSLISSEVAHHIENALSLDSVTEKGGAPYSGDSGDIVKVLIRVEERLAESARLQLRAISSELDDFQKQRADMLRALTEQTEASNGFRSELQQLVRQFGTLIQVMEKGNNEVSAQISELTIQTAADAKESRKLLASHADGQKLLLDTIDSYNIEERLAESARLQQRKLSAEIDDFQKQRAEMLLLLAEQTEASRGFRSELQEFGRQLGSLVALLEKGNGDVCSQVSELMVHMAADAKESHKLLAMQVNEQMRLRDSLDLRVKSNNGEQESFIVASR